jgi:hypothetical protein
MFYKNADLCVDIFIMEAAIQIGRSHFGVIPTYRDDTVYGEICRVNKFHVKELH